MNRYIFILFYLIPLFSFAEENFLASFISGEYTLVAQGIDTQETYSGSVSIYLEENKLKIKRVINGKTIFGLANFETALNGDANVLRIRFSEMNINYEETCLFRSDLDNYARISCYLYIPGKTILKPGLETFFINHSL